MRTQEQEDEKSKTYPVEQEVQVCLGQVQVQVLWSQERPD